METPPRLRLNPQRALTAFTAFMRRVREVAPHVSDEAEKHARVLYGELPHEDPADWRPVRGITPERYLRRAEEARRLLKRPVLTTELSIAVSGEITKQFLRVWRGYQQACGAASDSGDVTFQIQAGRIELSWATGCYHLFREVLLPGDEYREYCGPVIVSQELLARGGAYQITETADGLKLEATAGRLATWRLALAFCRDGYGRRRLSRDALEYRDILGRFRAGASLQYTLVAGRYGRTPTTKVSLAAGKPDPDFTRALQSRLTAMTARAEKVRQYIERLEQWAVSQADAFLSQPEILVTNAQRDLESAWSDFRTAAQDFHALAPRVCYKRDIPAEPFQTHPGELPPIRAVSAGLQSQYARICHALNAAWEHIGQAREALELLGRTEGPVLTAGDSQALAAPPDASMRAA